MFNTSMIRPSGHPVNELTITAMPITPPGASLAGARRTFRLTARINAPAVSRRKFFHLKRKFTLRIAFIYHPGRNGIVWMSAAARPGEGRCGKGREWRRTHTCLQGRVTAFLACSSHKFKSKLPGCMTSILKILVQSPPRHLAFTSRNGQPPQEACRALNCSVPGVLGSWFLMSRYPKASLNTVRRHTHTRFVMGNK